MPRRIYPLMLVHKFFFSIMILVLLSCSSGSSEYVSVESGVFRAVLAETGELQAVRHKLITMPPFNWEYGQPKLTELAKEGITVRKGEVVGQIETAGVTRALGQKRADLEIAKADLAKLMVEQQNEIKQAEAEIKSAESQLSLSQIGMERVKFESRAKKEVAELELESARMGLEKSRNKLKATERIHIEDLRIQRAKISQIESAIASAEFTIEMFTLRSPGDGMLEYRQNRRTRRKVAVGDQFWRGQPILGIPDLNQMKISSTVNENDRQKTHVGQYVAVRLDAFPKMTFKGTVNKISRVSRAEERGSQIKVFDVEIMVEGSHTVLKPGMTVRCEYLVADLDDALFVDPAGVHKERNEYVVYVKDGLGLRKVPVTLGPRNARAVVVQGDVKAGDEVATQPPEGKA